MNPRLVSASKWILPRRIEEKIKHYRNRARVQPTDPEITLPADLIELVKSNRRFRDIHKGRRCFILATGPSIRSQDLSGLGSEICIAVSHFFLHQDIDSIHPKYHVIAPYHPPFGFADAQKLFSTMNEAYEVIQPVCFLGYRPYKFSTYDFLKNNPNLVMKEYSYIDYSCSVQLDERNSSDTSIWDIAGAPFSPRTVIYSAIQLAVYMGFESIYLLGCDHDYLQEIDRLTNHHFYEEEEGVSDVAHLASFTLERWFQEYYMRWKQYRIMLQELNSRGITIANATQGGMLDVFPRVSLATIL